MIVKYSLSRYDFNKPKSHFLKKDPSESPFRNIVLKASTVSLALLKAQICITSFQTCTQIFGIHKAPIHVRRYKLIRDLSLSCILL